MRVDVYGVVCHLPPKHDSQSCDTDLRHFHPYAAGRIQTGPTYENDHARNFLQLEEATLFTPLRRIHSWQRARWFGVDIEDYAYERWIHHPDTERLGASAISMAGSGAPVSLLCSLGGRH